MDELNALIEQMLATLEDGLDHPELWQLLREVIEDAPPLAGELLARVPTPGPLTPPVSRTAASVLRRVLMALAGDVEAARSELEALMAGASQNRLVQGALFMVEAMAAARPIVLDGRVCPMPFIELDVLERSAHLCCASWLPTSIGDLQATDWHSLWNSPQAQEVRASVLDGSYRHCNKQTCPVIQADALLPRAQAEQAVELRLDGPYAYLGVAERPIKVSPGWLSEVRDEPPAIVNLAYDRSCNLACPSCRSSKHMADGAERESIDALQQRNVLPLLERAQLALITGSGDPFASKTFRKLLGWISADTTPRLQVKLMTNGLLLDAREWAKFGSLHDRVCEIKVSIDGVSPQTHDVLRLGSDWSTVRSNLQFIGSLARSDQGPRLVLAFIVQAGNVHEMGAAVELAREVGAHEIHFARLTNWGTFSEQQYRERAIFLEGHPRHAEFAAAMIDSRLADPIVRLGDLVEAAPVLQPATNATGPDPDRLFPVDGDRRVCFLKNAIRNPNIIVGDYTYYDDPQPPEDFEHRNVLYHYPFVGDKLVIGRFCSLARGVRFIMNGANHATDSASTYLFPFFGHGWEHIGAQHQTAATQRGDTVIGNDVWIGYEACIMPGVTVADGAVIGARAVVTRDVPPYAVVAGNPARVVRYRFEPAIIEALLDSRWWDWPPQRVARDLPGLLSDIRQRRESRPAGSQGERLVGSHFEPQTESLADSQATTL